MALLWIRGWCLPHTHPSSVALALVAESEDEAYGQNRYDNGEQDTQIVVWLERWEKKLEV